MGDDLERRVARVRRYNAQLRRYEEKIKEIKAKRAEDIREMRAAGWTYREIGKRVGLHHSRIGQLLKEEHADEDAAS